MRDHFKRPRPIITEDRCDRKMQDDGATCHTSNVTLPVVKEIFPNKLISRRGDIPWPPRSPDLAIT